MTLTTLALNGTPIEDLGLEIVGLDSWHNITERSYPTVVQPLRRGNRVLSTSHTAAARMFSFRLLSEPSTFTDRAAQMDALAAQFTGLVSVSTVDTPDRACYGLLKTVGVTAVGPTFVLPSVYADCMVVCDDPLYYDTSATITAIAAGTQGSLPQGTGPVRRMIVTVNGPNTDPLVILRDQTGAIAQQIQFGIGAISGSQWFEIDCDAYTVTLQPSATNILQVPGGIGATDTFFELRAPYTYTLECSSSDMSVSTYRSWEN